MPIGRIKWFGGLNTKTNKLNNYGFIQPMNEDLDDPIFVNRSNVSHKTQKVIEGKNGEGVYVEFEIIEDKQAKKRAVNLQLLKLLGVVEWFKEGRGYVQCENRPDVRISSQNFLDDQEKNINSDDILLFAIRYNSRYQKDEGFLIRQIDKNIENQEIINKCFHSSISKIFTPFISKYIDYIEFTSETIKIIEDKINLIDNKEEKVLIAKEICTKYIKVYLQSLSIRNLLSIDDYLLLLEDYFNCHGGDSLLYDDLIDRVKNTSNVKAELARKINNFEIIQKIIFNSNFNVYKLFLVKYLKHLSEDHAINFIIEKLEFLDNIKDRKELLYELYHEYDFIFLISYELRKWLMSDSFDLPQYCKFINNALKSTDDQLKKELLVEVFNYVKQSDNGKRIIIWHLVPEFAQYLKYRNQLWNFAPKKYQKQIIERKFEKFFQLQEQFANSSYPYQQYITANITDLFPLDDNSQKLIAKWDNDVNKNSYKAAQMMSARGAEKLVFKYYQNTASQSQVEDISIHQVTGKSQDWIQGDIRINGQTLLDVKNARTNVNSQVYSEFCVPSFKNNRGENVKIIAVLSPYLQQNYLVEDKLSKQPYKFEKISEFTLKVTEQKVNQKHSHSQQYKSYISEKKEYSFKVFAPTILGTFQKSELKELEHYFSERLISINMKRDNNINNYLPPWLFDYGKDFYCEQIKSIEEFKKLSLDDIPLEEDMEILEKECNNFIPIFICSKTTVPQSWLEKMPQWQINFINRLIESPTERITLPYVFLSILIHFLKMLPNEPEKYQPIEYLRILGGFSSEELTQLNSTQLSGFAYTIHPLKIYDPLNTIQSFCYSLQSIWENREKAKLNEFKIFKFNGQGLLTAQRFEGESPTTLLAYCGGWVEKKGKCGYKPLVIGKHQNCEICGRLICPKDDCQYCSDRCRGYDERKKTQKKENESNNKDNMDDFIF